MIVCRAMRARWIAAVAAGLWVVSAEAQSPGFVEISVTALGAGAASLGAAGESRLPLRPSDVSHAQGVLHFRARGMRGNVRELVLDVPTAVTGERTATGGGAVLRFTFASGQTMEPRPEEGWVTLTSWDGTRAAGEFEATLVQGRMTLHSRGRFEATAGAR